LTSEGRHSGQRRTSGIRGRAVPLPGVQDEEPGVERTPSEASADKASSKA